MALVPPEKAPSSDSSGSDDENLLQKRNYDDDDVTYCSSDPQSYPSSLDRMNILTYDDEDIENIPSPHAPIVLSDEETVPLSPVINKMFPSGRPQEQLPLLNSVSSVLSPLINSPAATTRSKRKTNAVSRVVSKRVKKFVRKPLIFKWKRNKFQHSAIIELPSYVPPVEATVKSPLDYFNAFFSENIFKLITDNTNLYSGTFIQSGAARSINITTDDIRDFIAITLLMGVVQMPSYRDYWSNALRYPLVANIMTLKKYEKIRRYLHFVDNTDTNDDRYFKVRPILECVRNNCLQLVEEKKYSVDEMMVPYKGTRAGSRRQYLPKKLKKWDFKIFVRAGVSGLIYDFLPYGGEDTFRGRCLTEYENSLGLGAKVVIALCKTIKEKPSTVYFDNFFTSLELIQHLRNEYGLFSLGTIKNNRLRGCQTILSSDKVLAKKGRGANQQIVCNANKIAVVKWFDNKVVTLASSYVDSHPKEKIKRYCKETKSKVDVECPQNIVKHYNAHMSGVDLSDMISLYRSNFKTKR
ncbi:piggyBac transposable element-derived protein 4-like [Pieris napi]|uniref:piggyBac transposable element-derived protein 4-like n=1 Tax=Pieris napi TaxID=78633 RepID=UPI001FB99CC2|nr:piggyBac transposable element-derived protein 4-like [Pieris napi]